MTQVFTRNEGTNPIYLGWQMSVWWRSDKNSDSLVNRDNATFENIEIISIFFEPIANPTTILSKTPSAFPSV